MNYDETQQKLIVREVERDLLAIVAIDIATDEYEVVYSDGAYRDFENRYRRQDFFSVWVTSGVPLVYAPDRPRMAREISKDFLLEHLRDDEPYTTTCRFAVKGEPEHCRIKVTKDVVEPGNLILSIRNIDQEVRQERERQEEAALLRRREQDVRQLQEALERMLAERQEKDIRIRTFGRFSVLVKGKPVPLRGKAKEILALVVTKRGKEISNEEIYSTIWENRPYSNEKMTVYYNALHRLKQTLEKAGISGLLVSTARGQMVDTDLFDCDYYDWIDGNPAKGESFQGEFLSEYSWSEYLRSTLNENVQNT